MRILDFFRRSEPAAAAGAHVSPQASGSGFLSLDDPRVIEFLRFGDVTATGITVNVERALKNPAMFRAVSIISFAIGMLPLQLIHEETKKKATDHPLYRVLHRRPNGWQSAFDFRTLMQLRALVKGNGYALVLRSTDLRNRGAEKVGGLVPLDPDRMEPKQLDDWSVVYDYQPKTGARRRYQARDILHLRGLSLDGITGLSTVKQAAEPIALALAAELAAGRVFKNGALVSGALKHPGKLSDPAFERLKASLAEKEGAENAGKNLILEEGMDWASVSSSAKDAQLIEIRKMQIEEIGRATGVPRPLLMMDDTSWGSGIAELGRFFVQFALTPWFEAWQQACERTLLSDAEADALTVKFNAGALLRGSVKDQGEFFAKALGAGGQPGFMTQNEVRDMLDMPRVEGGDELSKGAMGHNGGPALDDPEDDTAPKPKRSPKKDEGDED
ncbi:phage portal protein, HK97 family [Ancylobacter novellus DSM 506]|uniref:Phage portal protein, HK97 family n=1 Tax=Ancylobacter novellus (strain ATCC 8093 / DSM 506 / JCM 20403 / CCM 1077 / IAM 12100 / NBRC 12443 / NCIMB 10456) TaxID=639283 RepID=D6ZZT6_ANCN5|nr:phage portal protein [Ancylobacter novellus]ADH87350.1 phage portal protein, HK97 family [Ancylobacter novellus DSM 506]